MQDKPPMVSRSLRKKEADPNPIKQFERWFQQSVAAEPVLPEAITLSTADKEGRPSARMVLLKAFDERGFVFYTNYQSRKSKELGENPHAALLLYWRQLQRQISITGTVSRVSRQESETYFRTRARASQISAHASRQSDVIASREVLEDRFEKLTAEYAGQEIPLPSYWGGYRLFPHTIEFWQGRPDRLHDRLLYKRQPDGGWRMERLSP